MYYKYSSYEVVILISRRQKSICEGQSDTVSNDPTRRGGVEEDQRAWN